MDINETKELLSHLGNKWTIPVLTIIEKSQNPIHYSEIEAQLPGISQKMLSQTLKFLESKEIVKRKFYPGIPPQTEYAISTKGKELFIILRNLIGWSNNH